MEKSVPNSVKCGGCSAVIEFAATDLAEVSPRRGSPPDLKTFPHCADYKHVCGKCGRTNCGSVNVTEAVAERLLADKKRRQTDLRVVAGCQTPA